MPTILIADDHPALIDILVHVFQAAGYTALPALDGTQAIEIAQKQHIDVALLDIHMPGADGFAVGLALREIARDRGESEPPTWIMTGAHTHQATLRAAQIGARGVLRKPFEFAALLREIEAVLNRTAVEDRVGASVDPAAADRPDAVSR